MFHNCVFDLYGTLVDIRTDEKNPEIWKKLALFFRYYGADYRADELERAFELQVQKRMKTVNGAGKGRGLKPGTQSLEGYPEMKIEEVFQELYQAYGISADMELAIHTGQFFRSMSTQKLQLYDGVTELLKTLGKSGKKVYLLSNAQRIFTAYELRALQIDGYFDGIFLSSDYGCRKPDPQFFGKLPQECLMAGKKTVMIGNDGTCDIQGALQMGFSAVYLQSGLSPEEVVTAADRNLKVSQMKMLQEFLLSD